MAGDALEMATVKRALTEIDVVTQSRRFGRPEVILKPTKCSSADRRQHHRRRRQS
jgi:hypothetical protein